jgi:hypothetical protein
MANEGITIFNIGQHADEVNAGIFQQRGESNLFNPKLKDANDTIVFIIRPMPYIKDPVHSMVSKAFYALNDPAGIIMFDSRTTFNRPAEQHFEFCPVSDLWLKLHNSKDPNIKDLEKQLRMQRANYCYVQIIAFPKDESLNNQMRVMSMPMELIKLFNKMAKPSDDDIKLGAKPIQPFDIIGGQPIKCTVTGKMVDGTLMRDWKVELYGQPCEASFPIGPNNQMTPVSKLKQDDIVNYFNEQQNIDIEAQYGYHEPANDVKLRTKAYLMRLVGNIPGLREVAASYFPEVGPAQAPTVAQPVAQPLPGQASAPQPPLGGQDPMQAAMAQAPTAPANAPESPATQAPAPGAPVLP